MRKEFNEIVEKHRLRHGFYRSENGDPCGLFLIPYQSNNLKILVSDGSQDDWEHVSVSLKNRCPNWGEMCFVKDLFWHPDEWVLQYHPAESDYVNNHPYCLHLWRPINHFIPIPPSIAVGFKGALHHVSESKMLALRELCTMSASQKLLKS